MPTPLEIKLHRQSRQLELIFDDGARFLLPCAYLRAHSPAAGEHPDNPDVTVTAIEPVGNYAVRLVFSDGHDSGLYTWEVLYHLGARKASEQESS
ncbi:gamma-butyrobetaine hydroxylase-like domain-containing protein [Methylohalobius crimeensis]|uniref:gamma-butyrobetaine hydroxylase-like domain-containing protein n=1 Tax=Methylohalobius crimeensis TaxID=244365 RepID=UPI0003B64E24|nr:DUF971 domain-containing protein [Methylohalobius crimeensis]